ncbi:hypothetical protein JCM21142_1687 [Saccharicrinis fermentans DSM 9555 = JCM 21142]|uniref:Phosphate-selective porin n=2 Tax=Saccharicrinis fermentans TaxID=982 RepID=W7YCA2_9BACT|nr:hypothetical protein JCM21142_1687 [Saccharicrinis fermentans DSM 9555 = JCM 21142]
MIKKNIKFILVLIFMMASLFLGDVYGQAPFQVSGYVTEMPSYTWQRKSDKLWDNLIHNRIHLNYSNNEYSSIRIEVRNRFFLGETVRHTPLYKFYLNNDPGWVDMSFNWGSSKSFVVNTVIDRLSYERSWGKWQLEAGRQRVSWSKSLVWNPNDVFNSYSYFDFDYEERPRMDGLHLTYDVDDEQRFEAVLKVDGSAKVTSALLYGFSKAGYDFQLLAGQMNQEDYLLGAGWSGSVADAGFYGELSFLSPINQKNDDILVLSVGSNYTFHQSLTVRGEYLYSSNLNSSFEDFGSLIFYTSSIKKLSVTEHSYMLSVGCPVTPSLDVSLAYVGFSFPVLKSFYVSPAIEYSLNEQLSLSGIFQLYSHEWEGSDVLQISSFVRLKLFF